MTGKITATTRRLTPGEYKKLGLDSRQFTNIISPSPFPGKTCVYNPERRQKEKEFDEIYIHRLTPILSVYFGVSFSRTYEGVELALITCIFPPKEDVS